VRIGFDLTALLPVETGVDRYLIELVRALARVNVDHRFVVFVNPRGRARLGGAPATGFTVLTITVGGRAGRFVGQQLAVPLLSGALGLDVVHSPSFLMPAIRGRQRHVLTVFDTTFFTRPSLHTRFRRSRPFQVGVAASIRRADRVVVPSKHVKGELCRIFPEIPQQRVKVIPLGVGPEFRPANAEDRDRLPAELEGIGDYVLFVGTREPRKNLATLLEAYRRATRDHGLREHLVIVGRQGWGDDAAAQACDRAELSDRVHLTGYVDSETLVALYRSARVFVYPSVEEGFGLPPLEAMACGVPTIAGANSSMAEYLDGAAELVPVDDAQALSEGLVRVLRSAELRAGLRARGLVRARRFRWEETARQTLSCYERLSNAVRA